MDLKNLKTDTVMQVIDETEDRVFRATFFGPVGSGDFYVKSKELYEAARPGMRFRLGFFYKEKESICTFIGEAERVWIRSGSYLILFKQVTDVEETTQRKYQREEIAVKVTLYHITENEMQENKTAREPGRAALTCVTYDISSGGLCLVSNDRLDAELEACFLTEFTLNKENFRIPARLIRIGNAPQMVNYRNDYGLEFMYDHLPGEETRLLGALLTSKISWGYR